MFRNFLLTFVIFVFSIAIFYMTIFNLDPMGEQRTIAFFAFFLSTFCGVASFFTFLFFFGAEIFLGKKLGSKNFLIAIRRGILVGIFVTAILGLQILRLLGIFETILLASFLAILEWIILSANK